MMYPSSSNVSSSSCFNGNDLISYPIQPFRPFPTESNPSPPSNSSSSSKQELQLQFPNYALTNHQPPPLSFFQFPYSPFEDNHDLFQHHDDHDFLLHPHQSPPLPEPAAATMEVSISSTKTKAVYNSSKPPVTARSGDQIPATKRRSSKRDRHSKINTARGLRDRRMRLSLEVAKRFFGLQDMLGFDKASKTVEWLLNQAKAEIKELARDKNHPSYCSSFCGKSSSSTSECEGVSSLDEVGGEPTAAATTATTTTTARAKRIRANNKASRKSAFNPIDKESREKARERARERTREKKKMMTTKTKPHCNDHAVATTHGLSNLGGSIWNPFETVEESGNLVVGGEAEEEPSPQGKEEMAHEDSFVIMSSKWSPNMIFNSLINNSAVLQEHQFGEFQSMGKPWEAYNNHI